MSDVVRKSGVTWQTGSQQRSDIHFRLACEYVRNGRLGKLKLIRVGLASDNRDNNGCAAQTAPTPKAGWTELQLRLSAAPDAPSARHACLKLALDVRLLWRQRDGLWRPPPGHRWQWALGQDESGPPSSSGSKATWPENGALCDTTHLCL